MPSCTSPTVCGRTSAPRTSPPPCRPSTRASGASGASPKRPPASRPKGALMVTDGLTPLTFLLFVGLALGSVVVLGSALVALALKHPPWARRLGWLEGAGLACYALLYLLASLTSHDRALGLGEEKHICEVDCHLAYAVPTVRRAGASLAVTARRRSDSRTQSEQRPRAPSRTP